MEKGRTVEEPLVDATSGIVVIKDECGSLCTTCAAGSNRVGLDEDFFMKMTYKGKIGDGMIKKEKDNRTLSARKVSTITATGSAPPGARKMMGSFSKYNIKFLIYIGFEVQMQKSQKKL